MTEANPTWTRHWQITDRDTGTVVAIAPGYTAHAAWMAARLEPHRAFNQYSFDEITPVPPATTIKHRVKRAGRKSQT